MAYSWSFVFKKNMNYHKSPVNFRELFQFLHQRTYISLLLYRFSIFETLCTHAPTIRTRHAHVCIVPVRLYIANIFPLEREYAFALITRSDILLGHRASPYYFFCHNRFYLICSNTFSLKELNNPCSPFTTIRFS